jgi:cell division topological specificity factor
MNLFRLFRRRETEPATAPIARERLQVLLEHERTSPNQPNLLTVLKDEIINAIARHVSVKPEAIKVRIERRKSTATMRIAVDIPK